MPSRVEVWLCLLKAPLNPAEKSFASGQIYWKIGSVQKSNWNPAHPSQHCGFQNNTRIIDITLEIFSTGISSSWVTLGSLERSLFRSVGLMSAAAVDSLLLKPPAGTPKPPAWTPRSGAPWKGITALSKVVTPKCLNQLIGWFFNDMWRFIILIFLCTQLTPWLMGWGLHHFLAIALVALVVVKLQESCWQACHHIVNVPKVFKACPLLRHSLHLYPPLSPLCIVIMTHVQIHPWTSAQLLWQQWVVSEAGLGRLSRMSVGTGAPRFLYAFWNNPPIKVINRVHDSSAATLWLLNLPCYQWSIPVRHHQTQWCTFALSARAPCVVLALPMGWVGRLSVDTVSWWIPEI